MWRLVATLVFGVALGATGHWAVQRWLEEVPIPQLSGAREDEARIMLQERGLLLGVVEEGCAINWTEGTISRVYDQVPALPRGSTVRVRINRCRGGRGPANAAD